MESIHLKTCVGSDGILKIQMPPEIKDMELDVMVIFQSSSNEEQQVQLKNSFQENLSDRVRVECPPRYNAWGKPVTRKSIRQTIAKIKQLRQEVAIDKNYIRSIKEEGRRF